MSLAGAVDLMTSQESALVEEAVVERRSVGTVVRWSEERGLGGIESPEVPGGCWVHYSCVLAADNRARQLTVGQVVPFGYEEVEQDGYPFRATWVGSLAPGQVRPANPDAPVRSSGPSQAYTSTLRLTFDDEGQGGS